jgi:hypothetical protein
MHQQGPLPVLLHVDEQLKHPGPILTNFGGGTQSHAAALFGYRPDAFLIRSSWGTSWGENGYAWMDLDYTAEAVIESYGVVI